MNLGVSYLCLVFNSVTISMFGRSLHSPPFATVAVEEISVSHPAEVHNLGTFHFR